MSYAVLSDCGTYRYLLGRWVGEDRLGLVVFLLLNPSTADATKNDPTLRRGMGYARSWGYSQLEFTNLYAFRASKPKVMQAARDRGVDIVGPKNDQYITEAARRADLVVMAWGAHPAALPRVEAVCQLVTSTGKALHCIDTTDAGQPNHPLMLRKTLMPKLWVPPKKVA